MKKWFKSLSKEQIQRYVFVSLLVLVFVAFFVSLTLANESNKKPSNDPIENPGNNDNDKDNKYNKDDNNNNNDNQETPAPEQMMLPMKEDFVVVRKFYDTDATSEEQELAVIQFGKRYYTSNGISLATKDKKQFEVLAALSGEVVSVDESPIYGVVITIKHQDDLYTEYSSLSKASVEKGKEVKQGDIIGVSGICEYDSGLSSHVYFKVMSGSKTFNPENVIGKTVTAILE